MIFIFFLFNKIILNFKKLSAEELQEDDQECELFPLIWKGKLEMFGK